jgi:NADP-dependent 3-hydroxy acid dehydrogenase YdfG
MAVALKKLNEQVMVITGASSGIGLGNLAHGGQTQHAPGPVITQRRRVRRVDGRGLRPMAAKR